MVECGGTFRGVMNMNNLITINPSKMYDISMPISETIKVYKGRPEKKPKIETQFDFKTGSSYESRLTMNLHTGTHIDAPLHMIEGGATMESIDIRSLFTECRVLDLCSCEGSIGKEDLENFNIESGSLLLLKTRNSFSDILEGDFIYLNESGARYLAEKKLKGVGIDALGIERDQSGHETHLNLMNNGVLIIEGLRLSEVPEGNYVLSALPLSIPGVEASPMRAVLFENCNR